MAHQQAPEATTTTTPRVVIAGRIKEATKRSGDNGTTFRTIINTPAPDRFGHPGTFEVRSLSSLGQAGAEVQVTCELKGYSRNYQGKNGPVNTAEHVLQAV
jgi:hypothetical protein